MTQRRPLIAGNWKMHGTLAEARALAGDLAARMRGDASEPFDMVLVPPFTAIMAVAQTVEGAGIALGGQDCHAAEKGAHTGDVAAAMLADLGCHYVIVGHSERRTDHQETDAQVKAKAEAALAAGLTVILCIGETEAERDAGQTLDVVARQLAGSLPEGAAADRVVIAYEPVWAIGTGRTPTVDDVARVHASIREEVAKALSADQAQAMRILYGGSVKAANAAELLALDNVDGALVGGASLKADDFWAIARACP